MKFLFLINLFLAQCWSAFTLDQNIPGSNDYQRRVQEVGSDIPVDVPVSYDCRFINRWTSSRHPNLFPPLREFWSRAFMVSHSEAYTMWSDDQLASNSVEIYARTGNTRQLQLDVVAAKTSVKNVTKSITYEPSGDFDEVPMGQLELDNEHRLISTIAKINPGPDWFSGLNSYSPVMNGNWLSSFTVNSFPWDAGTVDGTTYNPFQPVSVPKVNIFRYTVGTVPENGIFLNTGRDDVLPVAQWRCDFIIDDIPTPPKKTCFEGGETKFFRYNPETGLIPEDRPQDCFWLSAQNSKVQRRHCRRKRSFAPFPLDDTPLAREACRMTCDTCPL